MVRTRTGKLTMEEAHSTTPSLPTTPPLATSTVANCGLERSDTQTTLPLSEQDLLELQSDLRLSGHRESTFIRLLDHYRSHSAHEALAMKHEDHGYAVKTCDPNPVASKWELFVNRKDTLENNPMCVNPNTLEREEDRDEEGADNDYESNNDEEEHSSKSSSLTRVSTSFLTDLVFKSPSVADNATRKVEQCSDPSKSLVDMANGGKGSKVRLPVNQASRTPNRPSMTNGATAHSPPTERWPGVHNFDLHMLDLTGSTKNRMWDFSEQLNKLFIDVDKYIQIAFTASTSDEMHDDDSANNLYLRVLPVYTSPGDLNEPVRRCPNHKLDSDPSNKDFPLELLEHFVRVKHEEAAYERDPLSQRLSVVMPFQKPQQGSSYTYFLFKFMCLGSDIGGINRRPLMLIFTLEDAQKQTVGRQTLNLRVCSCPKRDRAQEERRVNRQQNREVIENNSNKNGLKRGLNSNDIHSTVAKNLAVNPKKRRSNPGPRFIMIPVDSEDFEKLNELAEAAAIMRNRDKEEEIKRERDRLLNTYNPNMHKCQP